MSKKLETDPKFPPSYPDKRLAFLAIDDMTVSEMQERLIQVEALISLKRELERVETSQDYTRLRAHPKFEEAQASPGIVLFQEQRALKTKLAVEGTLK